MEYSKGAVGYIILKEKKFATNEYANICKRQACGKAIGCEDLGINRNAYGQLWNLWIRKQARTKLKINEVYYYQVHIYKLKELRVIFKKEKKSGAMTWSRSMVVYACYSRMFSPRRLWISQSDATLVPDICVDYFAEKWHAVGLLIGARLQVI